MARKEIKPAVLEAAMIKNNPAGEEYASLSLVASERIVEKLGCNRLDVELVALEEAIVPERYQRNLGTLGLEGQKKLLQASVGVLGAGGLGGHVVDQLARMGLGRLVVVDGDTFHDSNLNRQLLLTERDLGRSKVEVAAERVAAINSAVHIDTFQCRGDRDNLGPIFSGCDLVVDCLDNLPSRFHLEEVCSELGIIMIHGAIAGYLGQLAVIRPQNPIMAMLYGNYSSAETGGVGAEVVLGNPASTPAMLASWQAAQAVKVITGMEGVLPPDRLLIIDMQTGESYKIELSGC